MLVNQTLYQLQRMKLYGLAEAFAQQLQRPDTHSFSFEERFSLLVDRELNERENRRLPRLLQLDRLRQQACVEDIARGDGTLSKRLAQLGRTELFILDDFWLKPIARAERHDLLEVIEDGHAARSTLITSQLPIAYWHEYPGEPTVVQCPLDRLLHNAYKLELKGDSMRKSKAALTG